jgi:hypothetical protein
MTKRKLPAAVLAGKGGTQQQHSRLGQLDRGIKPVGEFVRVPTERAREVAVTPLEADDDVVQGRAHVVVGQGEDALEYHT